MTNEIYTNRKNDSTAWIIVTKGQKYLTLKYQTCHQGHCDVTITYPLEAESQLLHCLNHIPAYGIEELCEQISGTPAPLKITKSKPIQ